jgi:hypothetical protein
VEEDEAHQRGFTLATHVGGGNHRWQAKEAVEGAGSRVMERWCARLEVVAAMVGSEIARGGLSMWLYSKRSMVDNIVWPRVARWLAVTDLVLARLDM